MEISSSDQNSENSQISCEHKELSNGICTGCGLCIDTQEFQDSYTETTKFTPISQMKYSVKDPMKEHLSTIRRILIPLSLEGYLYQIRDLLLITSFTGRLKTEDKIILLILHFLKINSFPIALQDLLKYTNISKYRLLKIYRDTFSYTKNSPEYFHGIFDRTAEMLKKKGMGIAGNKEEYLSILENFKSTDPKLLCMAYLYEKNKIPLSKAISWDEYTYSQLQYVRKKLKQIL